MIKQIIASVTLVVLISLALNPTIFAMGDSTTRKTISANMEGFAFTNDGCCPDVSLSINGEIITNKDGTLELSQQSGSITIGSVTIYQLEFNPSGKITKEIVNNDCTSGTTYQQNGQIILFGNNGSVFKGLGVYSWGTFPGCSGNEQSFVNFSGTFQDSKGQSTEFYTGRNLSPTIQ